MTLQQTTTDYQRLELDSRSLNGCHALLMLPGGPSRHKICVLSGSLDDSSPSLTLWDLKDLHQNICLLSQICSSLGWLEMKLGLCSLSCTWNHSQSSILSWEGIAASSHQVFIAVTLDYFLDTWRGAKTGSLKCCWLDSHAMVICCGRKSMLWLSVYTIDKIYRWWFLWKPSVKFLYCIREWHIALKTIFFTFPSRICYSFGVDWRYCSWHWSLTTILGNSDVAA